MCIAFLRSDLGLVVDLPFLRAKLSLVGFNILSIVDAEILNSFSFISLVKLISPHTSSLLIISGKNGQVFYHIYSRI